jgi:hypothetical protein
MGAGISKHETRAKRTKVPSWAMLNKLFASRVIISFMCSHYQLINMADSLHLRIILAFEGPMIPCQAANLIDEH